ncbi:MAG: hypothetical protein LM575_00870 [Caldimicrobium sp.]|nr:hypothetical protein [Caldimicrobium sp.]
MIGRKSEILVELFERYEEIDGRKILDILREFGFRDDERTFERVCLMGVLEYLDRKDGEMTDEEVLACLIRLVLMHFVEKKYCTSLWYLLLLGLMDEELQKSKPSEVVKRLEEQFIEHMEMIEAMSGPEGIRNMVLVFLFKENAEYVLSVLEEIEWSKEGISRLLN